MKIQSPEQLFGIENVSRKLVVMAHELITIKLQTSIPDLSEFARKIKEAEFCPEQSRGVILRTPWGTVIVNANSFQLQQIRELNKVNILSTFVWDILRSEKETSFEEWFRRFISQIQSD
jgi:hypothetical protein